MPSPPPGNMPSPPPDAPLPTHPDWQHEEGTTTRKDRVKDRDSVLRPSGIKAQVAEGVPRGPGSPRTTHKSVVGLTDDEIHSRELWIAARIVRYPKGIMCCCGVAALVMCVIGFGVVGIALTDGEWTARDDINTQRWDAWLCLKHDVRADENLGVDAAAAEGHVEYRLREIPAHGILFIYDTGGGDIFSADHAREMWTTEWGILNADGYNEHCPLQHVPAGDPPPPQAIPQWDYGTVAADGSRMWCQAPGVAVGWLLYNRRFARKMSGVMRECGPQCFDGCGGPAACFTLAGWAAGDWAWVLLSELPDDHADAATAMAAGGKPPTAEEMQVWARALGWMATNLPPFQWIPAYFSKYYNVAGKADADPAKWRSPVARSYVPMGAPREKTTSPGSVSPACHVRDEAACAQKGVCVWGSHAGYYLNATGCGWEAYPEVWESLDKQMEDWAQWAKGLIPFLNDRSNAGGPHDVLWFTSALIWDQFLIILMRDALLAVGSLAFVYLYLQIHTHSFFLATLGMTQILMPFPMAYFTYRCIFQVGAFYGLSTLTLYIVLAIGADDIFVFMDNWVEAAVSGDDEAKYMKGRMSWAWRRAGGAMFITSLTTMSAFIATMVSPILQISTFGLLAATLVFYDYCLVMTFFASAVVVYHRRWESTVGCQCCGEAACGAWCNCCTCYTELLDHTSATKAACCEARLLEMRTPATLKEARGAEAFGADLQRDPADVKVAKLGQRSDTTGDTPGDTDYRHKRWLSWGLLGAGAAVYAVGFASLIIDRSSTYDFVRHIVVVCVGLCMLCGGMNASHAASARLKELSGGQDGGHNFFRDSLGPFLAGTGSCEGTKLRFLPSLVLLGVWGAMVVSATDLKPTSKADQFLPDWHPLQRFVKVLMEGFPQSSEDDVERVYAIFGVNPGEPIDRAGTDKYADPDESDPCGNTGRYVLRPAELESEGFQQYFLAVCDEVWARSSAGVGDPLQRTTMGIKDQSCVMREFRAWLNSSRYISGTTVYTQTAAAAAGVALSPLPFPVPGGDLAREMWRFMEWERAVDPHEAHEDYVLFGDFDAATQSPAALRAVVAAFNTTLNAFANPYDDNSQWADAWNAFHAEAASGGAAWSAAVAAPADNPWRGAWYPTAWAFVWRHTQFTLVRDALLGTLTSLGLATGVILAATLNPIIAALVLLELIGVVGCVLGVVPLLGWEMGTTESVCITILVGLSVDYVVHFAIHYCEASWEDRHRRVHETIEQMGPTVLGGAATSLGAAMMLWCTWLQFFFKFGAFLFMTVLSSYMWAVFFFMPMLSAVGPQGPHGQETCSLRPLLSRLCPRIWSAPKGADGKAGEEQHECPPVSPSDGIATVTPNAVSPTARALVPNS